MAQLDCTVDSCLYNKTMCCCKGDILVGGTHADTEEETCCESFYERRGDSYTSAIEHPSEIISIDCEAENCTYNSNFKCVAEHVDICGSGANRSIETLCATFEER